MTDRSVYFYYIYINFFLFFFLWCNTNAIFLFICILYYCNLPFWIVSVRDWGEAPPFVRTSLSWCCFSIQLIRNAFFSHISLRAAISTRSHLSSVGFVVWSVSYNERLSVKASMFMLCCFVNSISFVRDAIQNDHNHLIKPMSLLQLWIWRRVLVWLSSKQLMLRYCMYRLTELWNLLGCCHSSGYWNWHLNITWY